MDPWTTLCSLVLVDTRRRLHTEQPDARRAEVLASRQTTPDEVVARRGVESAAEAVTEPEAAAAVAAELRRAVVGFAERVRHGVVVAVVRTELHAVVVRQSISRVAVVPVTTTTTTTTTTTV